MHELIIQTQPFELLRNSVKNYAIKQGLRNRFQLGKRENLSIKEALALEIIGCMHRLPKIDGCSCTLCTRSNECPVKEWSFT